MTYAEGELTQCHPAHESRYLGVARIDLFPRWKRLIAAVGGVCVSVCAPRARSARSSFAASERRTHRVDPARPARSGTYRVWPLAACSVCGGTSLEQPRLLSLVQLGLSRAHDHRDLANRCSHAKKRPDFGLKCLFKPYFDPSPCLGGSGPRGAHGCLPRWHLVYGTI